MRCSSQKERNGGALTGSTTGREATTYSSSLSSSLPSGSSTSSSGSSSSCFLLRALLRVDIFVMKRVFGWLVGKKEFRVG